MANGTVPFSQQQECAVRDVAGMAGPGERKERCMIRLRNEGPLQPAPKLNGYAEEVSAELQSWPGMISATHWKLGDSTRVDGAEFHVEKGGELGHIHLNGQIHVPLSRQLRNQLVAHKLAEPFLYDGAWITAPIGSRSEADQAIWLLRLGYDRLLSTPDDVLAQRIEERATTYSAQAEAGGEAK